MVIIVRQKKRFSCSNLNLSSALHSHANALCMDCGFALLLLALNSKQWTMSQLQKSVVRCFGMRKPDDSVFRKNARRNNTKIPFMKASISSILQKNSLPWTRNISSKTSEHCKFLSLTMVKNSTRILNFTLIHTYILHSFQSSSTYLLRWLSRVMLKFGSLDSSDLDRFVGCLGLQLTPSRGSSEGQNPRGGLNLRGGGQILVNPLHLPGQVACQPPQLR